VKIVVLIRGAQDAMDRGDFAHATELCILTSDGMMHLRNGGEFALIVFSERCDSTLVDEACESAMMKLAEVLSPV
jgi:hypothetical protein